MFPLIKASLILLFLLSILFLSPNVFATPYYPASGTKPFPADVQNSMILRITSCFLDWLESSVLDILASDTSANYCLNVWNGTGFGGGCGWKTLNLLNAVLMDMLDKDENTPVMCCCDLSKDSDNCTTLSAPATCPVSYPNVGTCTKLDAGATNYLVATGYQPFAVTWVAPGGTTVWAYSGLLDQSLSIPLVGSIGINLALNDVCNSAGTCGPPLGYVAGSNPGYCFYPYTNPSVSGAGSCLATQLYGSQATDRFILYYNPAAFSVSTNIGELSGVSCGFPGTPGPIRTNLNLTGNEGFLNIVLQLGSLANPVRIDIDAVTPARGNDPQTFTASAPPVPANNIAPGTSDCDASAAGWQGKCYVRAYLQLSGALLVGIGATAYMEHRVGSSPHMQDLGLSIKSIDISQNPWIALALDWRWIEPAAAPNCSGSSTSACPRREATLKASKLIEFIDLIIRGLFRYSDIPASVRPYFGPIVMDLSDTFAMGISHLVPTWSRPVNLDAIFLDISMGGPEFSPPSNILRSYSCFADYTVGDSKDELWLIGAGLIDFEFYRKGSSFPPPSPVTNNIPSCGYVGTPYPPVAGAPSSPGTLPYVGNLADCSIGRTHIGASISRNIFTRVVSDLAAEGIMCVVAHKDAEGLGGSVGSFLKMPGFKSFMPELESFLKSEFGDAITDLPIILALKPKAPDSTQVPQAALCPDWTAGTCVPNIWTPNPSLSSPPVTADVVLAFPFNDFEIWIDVDGKVEQWEGVACTCGPVACPAIGAGNYLSGQPVGTGFIANFPDTVSFIDCDTTQSAPPLPDRPQERRFLGEFQVGISLGVDINIFGCGRNLLAGIAYGAWGTWFNPWNPSSPGDCVNPPSNPPIPYLRRLDLQITLDPEVKAFDATNDSGGPRIYYPFSGGTYASYIADLIGVLLSGILNLRGQVGFTLRPIIDSGDDFTNPNDVMAIGTQTASRQDALTITRISRDDYFGGRNDFLTFSLDFTGKIHPNFFYNIIAGALGGGGLSLGLSPRFNSGFNGSDGFNSSDGGILLSDLPPFNIVKTLSELDGEVKIKFKDLMKYLRKLDVLTEVTEGKVDAPPETIVEWIKTEGDGTEVKVNCVDDKKSGDCWYQWRICFGDSDVCTFWSRFITTDTFRLPHLLDGEYVLEVRAIDIQGWPDFTPERVKFVVDSDGPMIFFPQHREFGRRGGIEFKVWDNISHDRVAFSWRIDEGEWSQWFSPKYSEGVAKDIIYFNLQEGTHTLYLRAKDERGNITEEEFTFEVKGGKVLGCGGR